MKKHILLLFLLILQTSLFAQQDRFRVSGRVVDKLTGEALLMAPVQLKGLGIFTVTDLDGRFTFDALPAGTQTFVVQYLGYQTLEDTVLISRAIDNLLLRLESQSLSLEVVEVTARQGTDMTSSSVVNRQALEHVQPTSLQDVLQLVPGFVDRGGPGLMDQQLLTIRSIATRDGGDGFSAASTNAFGVAIVMDGAMISSDASMGEATISTSGRDDMRSAQAGFDSRQLSADNIESVEVIRGIPSVTHGNMTSGAIVVRTRAGVSPYDVRFRTDPRTKLLSASKGFRVGGAKGGIMNVSADYTNAIGNLIQRNTEVFDRFNLNLGYSTNFLPNLTTNIRFTGNYNVKQERSDPDLGDIRNWEKDETKSARLNIGGTYNPKNPLNIFVDYTLAGSITERNTHIHRLDNTAVRSPFSTSREDDTMVLASWIYLQSYYREAITHSVPVDFQAKFDVKSVLKFDNEVSNRALIGGEWSSQGNIGNGRERIPFEIPRVRQFNEIPFFHRFSVYAENQISVPIGSTTLDVQAGVRANVILPNEAFEDYQLTSVEPRFNARYQLIQKNTGWLRELSFRAGWGLLYRMPNLTVLFPEPVYQDRILFRYDFDDITDTAFALIHTRRVKTEIGNTLKMPRAEKFELGIDFKIGRQTNGILTFFMEDLNRSYERLNIFTPYYGEIYYLPDGSYRDGSINQDIATRAGQSFFLQNGLIHYLTRWGTPSIDPLERYPDSIFESSPHLLNAGTTKKWGFEMVLNLGRIKPINTSIQIDAAYFNIATATSYNGLVANMSSRSTPRNLETYTVQFFQGSAEVSNVSVNHRLSSNIRLITHIPRVGIVTTLTTSVVIFEGRQNRSDMADLIYFYDTEGIYGEAGKRHSGDIVFRDEHYIKHINPVHFMDIRGNIHPFTREMELDPEGRFDYMRLSTGNAMILRPYLYAPQVQFDFRVSKDIKRTTVSLFARNFLNLPGTVREYVRGHYEGNRNPVPVFGAEVRMRF